MGLAEERRAPASRLWDRQNWAASRSSCDLQCTSFRPIEHPTGEVAGRRRARSRRPAAGRHRRMPRVRNPQDRILRREQAPAAAKDVIVPDMVREMSRHRSVLQRREPETGDVQILAERFSGNASDAQRCPTRHGSASSKSGVRVGEFQLKTLPFAATPAMDRSVPRLRTDRQRGVRQRITVGHDARPFARWYAAPATIFPHDMSRALTGPRSPARARANWGGAAPYNPRRPPIAGRPNNSW